MATMMADGQYYGALRELRRVAGLTLSETGYRPGMIVPDHVHDHALLVFVLRGGFVERSARRRRDCEPGTLLFHPSAEPHAHEFYAAEARCFTVNLGEAWEDRVREHGPGALDRPIGTHASRATWLAEHLHREFAMQDSASALAIEGYTLAILGELAREVGPAQRGSAPSWLARAVDLLHARYLDTLGMSTVAAEVGVHPVHLARQFRRYHGCTMGEYVRRLRIEYACQRLAQTDEPLSSIAYTAGFADQGHFSRTFRRVTGTTPGTYRRVSRGT
jgi:AraC family transcriptional regulator